MRWTHGSVDIPSQNIFLTEFDNDIWRTLRVKFSRVDASDPEEPLSTLYTYDALGNLKEVTLPDGTVIDYLVDRANRRIGKKVNGELERLFLYQDGLRPIAELDGDGNLVSRFIYSFRANVPDFMLQSGVTYRILSDHLGSPPAIVNLSTGALVQEMSHDEFGNVNSDSNPASSRSGLRAGSTISDTKLTRFGARD